MSVGIIGYGAHIPRYRIKLEEIAKVWGADAPSIKASLELTELSVAAPDQDVITLAVEAVRNALLRADHIDPQAIGAIYVGSESKPYAAKPTGTVVGEAIGATPAVHVADIEFACKAGTESIFITYGLVKARLIQYGLAVGADTAQAAPGDASEYSAAAGAAAFVIGSNRLIATIDQTFSFATDTPDFWRRQYAHFPRHTGRFTGAPAYFRTVEEASRALLQQASAKPSDFEFAVFH